MLIYPMVTTYYRRDTFIIRQNIERNRRMGLGDRKVAHARADELEPRKMMTTFSQYIANFVDINDLSLPPFVMLTPGAASLASRLIRLLDTPTAYKAIKSGNLPASLGNTRAYLSGAVGLAYRWWDVELPQPNPQTRLRALAALKRVAEAPPGSDETAVTLATIARLCRSELVDDSERLSELSCAVRSGSIAAEGVRAIAEQWLADAYQQAGEAQRAARIRRRMLVEHPAISDWRVMIEVRAKLGIQTIYVNDPNFNPKPEK